MSPTVQTGFYQNARIHSSRYYSHTWLVEVEDFDHDIETFEIDADDAMDAANKASDLFDRDIYNILVYCLE